MPDWAYAADAAGTAVMPAAAGRPAGMRPGIAGARTGRARPGWGSPGDADGNPRDAAEIPGEASGIPGPAGGSDQAAARDLGPDDRTFTHPAEGDPADDVTRTWFRDTTPGNGARPGAHADTATAVTRPGVSAAAAGPRTGATVPGSPAPGSADHGAQPPGSGGTRDPAGRRRRWLISALVAVSVFVIAMGAVTAIEAIAGNPLETVVWHKKGSGTTIGGLVDGPAAHRHSRPAPTTSPSAPASPSSTPATTPPATPTPTPTGSGSTTPSPTPTPSSAPASPAPTGSGAAG